MGKKKIILTVTNDLTFDQRMIRICSSLSKEEYAVLLVGRQRSFSKPLIGRPFAQKRLNCLFDKGKLFYLEYNFRLFFFLMIAKFDLVCSVDLDSILPGFLASKIRHKICVYDAHEYFTELPEVVERQMVKKIWGWVGRLTIPRLKYAYTVGNCLAEEFEKRYGTPFEIIRNVPSPTPDTLKGSEGNVQGKSREEKGSQPTSSFFAFGKSHLIPLGGQGVVGTSIILYQGVLNEGRGLEEILQAMTQIEKAELWLAGEGDISDDLRHMTAKLNLKNRVRFWGYVEPEELKTLTPKATIGLNLLKNKGLNYYYSLANKAFDYIQAELPSIHMQFPEYQYINKQFEVFYLIENLEIPTLVHAIQKLLNDRTYYNNLRQNCRQAKVEYNWKKEERKLLDFYQQVFGES